MSISSYSSTTVSSSATPTSSSTEEEYDFIPDTHDAVNAVANQAIAQNAQQPQRPSPEAAANLAFLTKLAGGNNAAVENILHKLILVPYSQTKNVADEVIALLNLTGDRNPYS